MERPRGVFSQLVAQLDRWWQESGRDKVIRAIDCGHREWRGTHDELTFIRIYRFWLMDMIYVPHDKPVEALQLVSRWLTNEKL